MTKNVCRRFEIVALSGLPTSCSRRSPDCEAYPEGTERGNLLLSPVSRPCEEVDPRSPALRPIGQISFMVRDHERTCYALVS